MKESNKIMKNNKSIRQTKNEKQLENSHKNTET